jgi:hypothetical protein
VILWLQPSSGIPFLAIFPEQPPAGATGSSAIRSSESPGKLPIENSFACGKYLIDANIAGTSSRRGGQRWKVEVAGGRRKPQDFSPSRVPAGGGTDAYQQGRVKKYQCAAQKSMAGSLRVGNGQGGVDGSVDGPSFLAETQH